jgi:predicted GNAT superfamily acetyltransferase
VIKGRFGGNGTVVMTDDPRSAGVVSARLRADRGPLDLARLTASAAADADDAAARHGIRITELHDISDHLAVAAMLCRIWEADSTAHVVSPDLVRAFAHSGNYVAGAYVDGRLAGASIAFFGADHLHSHITGVDSSVRGHGVGFALKQHQRWWALSRGVVEIRWTFDPLIRRNAYFNIHRLGASVTAYLPEFYGAMSDGVNSGDESDRLLVVWDLVAPQPIGAAENRAAAVHFLDRVDEQPVPGYSGYSGHAEALVAVPLDVDALRRRDPAAVASWRREVRTALTGALAAGYRIAGMRRDGFYVLVQRARSELASPAASAEVQRARSELASPAASAEVQL